MNIPAEIIAVIITTIASLITGILTFHVTRKKTAIDAASQTVTNALAIVNEYQDIAKDSRERMLQLEKEFDEYRSKTNTKLREQEKDIKYQEQKLEEFNSRVLKYQLILSIYLHQMKVQNISPMIPPEEWESISIEDLRLTVSSLVNIEKRRHEN